MQKNADAVCYAGDDPDLELAALADGFPAIRIELNPPTSFSLALLQTEHDARITCKGTMYRTASTPFGEESWRANPFVLRRDDGVHEDTMRECSLVQMIRAEPVSASDQTQPYDRTHLSHWPKKWFGSIFRHDSVQDGFLGCTVLVDGHNFDLLARILMTTQNRITLQVASPDLGYLSGLPESRTPFIWDTASRKKLRLSSVSFCCEALTEVPSLDR